MRERSTYLKWQRALIFQTVIRGGVRVQEPGHEATLPQTETDLILMAKRSHQVGGVGGGVTGLDLSFRVMSCWPELGGWMRGDKAEARRASHASLHHPQLVSPRPALTSCSLPTLAGAGWDVGAVRTLTTQESSATRQTSRPGFLWFLNLEKLLS